MLIYKGEIPLAMDQNVKLFTHETIVHSQIAAIEKLLERKVDFVINLNNKALRSSLVFTANADEIKLIKDYLGYTVLVKDGNHWIPEI